MGDSSVPLRRTKAIIFDFDGVILESADIKTRAFLELFAAYPQHQSAIQRYHLQNLGVSRYDKFAWIYRELLGKPFTAAERERLGSAFSTLVLEHVLRCPFVPGALETLQALHHQRLVFVASGSPQEELELIVRRRGLSSYFTEVWGTPLKKEQIILRILERFGLHREEVLFVGDGLSDYQAAMATGIQFLARVTPEAQQRWQELGVPRADDLRQICSLIGIAHRAELA